MKLDKVVFINNLPTLDLHGYDRQTAVVAISDFIRDNIKLKNEIIVIIHGIGNGIIRKSTHEYLKSCKNVLEFKTYYYNEGSTIVALKLWQRAFFMVY